MCIRDRRYTLQDHRRSADTRQKLNILTRIAQYLLTWLEHLVQMDDCRTLKQLFNYRPKGRSCVGRPKKRRSLSALDCLLGKLNVFLLKCWKHI